MAEGAVARSRPDPEARRAQIMQEAIGLIGRLGYHGFTVEELAKRCGLTTAGLLYHFGTKERLFLAVLQEHDRRVTEFVHATRAIAAREARHEDSSLGALLEWLRAIMVFNATQPELVRLNSVLHAESLDHAHPAHDYFRERQDLVLEQFTKLFTPYVPHPGSTARQLIALMDGLTLQWLRADQGFDLVAEWDRVVAGLLPGGDHPSVEARLWAALFDFA